MKAVPATDRLDEGQRALVTANTGIVVFVCQRQLHYPHGTAIPEDLIAEGLMGLVEAARRFDPRRGFKFATYAIYWVRCRIMEYLVRNHGPVRFGNTQQERKIFFGLGRARRAVASDDLTRLAQHLDVDEAVLARVQQRMQRRDLSLDAPLADHNGKAFDLAGGAPSPEEALAVSEHADWARHRLTRAMAVLDARERKIILARFYRSPPLHLAELGREMKLSRERVRQLEVRALGRLREVLKAAGAAGDLP